MRKYLCRTDEGVCELTENDIYEIAQPIVWHTLFAKYPRFKRYYEDLAQEAFMAIFASMWRYSAEPDRGTIFAFIKCIASRTIFKRAKAIMSYNAYTLELSDKIARYLTAPEDPPEAYGEFLEKLMRKLTKAERIAVEGLLAGYSRTEIYNKIHRTKIKHAGMGLRSIWKSIEKKIMALKEADNDSILQ